MKYHFMPVRLPPRSTCVGPSSALAVVLMACTVETPPLAPPAPATLAAIRDLAPHPCDATTASVLDALGVPPAAVRSIYYDRRVSGSERAHLQGYDAWVRLADQTGELVIRHDAGCRFTASLTRGAVRLGPGRPS
jgi:hypothetical protein